MRVLVTGCKGLLGTDLIRAMKDDFEVTGLDHGELDITDPGSVRDRISEYQPDAVVNCAAFTNVDGCEKNIEASYRVNALGPRNLAIACNETGAALLHISTDYVFDGRKGKPYREDDRPNPLNAYGKSKLAGEEYVKSLCSRYYIVRSQWLYGLHGKNFVKTVFSLTMTQNELKVVNDQFGSPTYTHDLADACKKLIETKAYGTYHITNAGVVSWFDFAKDILELSGINGMRVVPIITEESNRRAVRPKYAPLENFNWRISRFSPLRNYRDALADCLKEEIGGQQK